MTSSAWQNAPSPEENGELVYQAALYNNSDLLGDLLTGDGDWAAQIDRWHDAHGRSALHIAAASGHARCLRLLVAAGADKNAACGPSAHCKTPLHFAAEAGQTEAVSALLEAGANPLLEDINRYTPVELAQMASRHDSARLLVDAIQQHHRRVHDARERLERACIDGDLAVAQSVLADSDPQSIGMLLNGSHDDDYTALYRASERGYVEIVKLLLRYGADGRIHSVTRYSPLYITVYAGHYDVARILLKSFPQLADVASFEGWLPIHAACKLGDVRTLRALLFHPYPEHTMKDFCDAAARPHNYRFAFDLNHPDADCRTPLYLAVTEGHEDVVRLLLEFNLDAVAVDQQSSSVGSFASNNAYEDVVVKDELSPSSDVGTLERPCDTPMKKTRTRLNAVASTSTPDVGGDKGQKSSASGKKQRHSDVDQGADSTTSVNATKAIRPVTVDTYSMAGKTPLIEAAAAGYCSIVKRLVRKGAADVNLPLAITDEQLALLSPSEEVQCAGSGALIEACKAGNLEMVELLLEFGAVDHENRALAASISSGHDELTCKLLCRQVFADTEFRVNKKGVDAELQLGMGKAVVPSALYPAVASMLNWHNAGLSSITNSWLIQAGLHLNSKMKAAIQIPILVVAAITRIDLSKNSLTELPLSLLQLPSLRILSVTHNNISSIAVGHRSNNQGKTKKDDLRLLDSGGMRALQWNCPVLEELHMEHNRLEWLPDELFTQVPNLQALDVSHNAISTLTAAVWLASKLKDLNLCNNRLTALPSWVHAGTPQTPMTPNSIAGHHFRLEPSEADGSAYSLDVWSPKAFSAGSEASFDDSCSQNTAVTDGADPPTAATTARTRSIDGDRISVQELRRHNLWQKSIELAKNFEEDDLLEVTAAGVDVSLTPAAVVNNDGRQRKTRSSLVSVNLSSNHLYKTPECLPCWAPNLSRLNLAKNHIREIGPVCNYPSKLKHLDLGGNKIESWFSSGRTAKDFRCHCGSAVAVGPIDSNNTSITNVARSRSPTGGKSRRRRSSQSVYARGRRSLSVAATARTEVSVSVDVASSLPTPALMVCGHKRHCRLENLRTLVLSGNRLAYIRLEMEQLACGASMGSLNKLLVDTSDRVSIDSFTGLQSAKPEGGTMAGGNRGRLIFPALTMLDVSNNKLEAVPRYLSDLTALSVLNLSQNPELTALPPEMGLLSKLWNLSLTGCHLGEPLKTMLDSKKYKTMDIMGYLKSVLEDSKQYARMKLMFVGIQGIGKTSLLEQLRQEGSVSNRKHAGDGWAKRMGNKNINQKTAKGVNISTVGVDVGDWTYEPKRARNQPVYGPITFRTWDFGGQREYYATHQYFLSRRSLYLVMWRVTDGEAGIADIQQWLVNIQARAPNSPVIIVGTHFDEVLSNSKKFPPSFVDDYQQVIRERFVAVQDADKKGLPRVVDSVVVSSKSRYNIKHLCQLIYSTAYELRSPGTKERVLDQKIPATYLALEDIVFHIAEERKSKGKDPVLSAEQYRNQVQELMQLKYSKTFRDTAELNQATAFLHENGVMLHYDDATLKELYFLDPQWLCDILAHVITIREINPFAKNGLMKLDDLRILFKASKFTPTNIRTYILNLLQKFEVALTWDSRNLLIPSLLPDEYHLRGGYSDSQVEIPIKGVRWRLTVAAPGDCVSARAATQHYAGAVTADNLMHSSLSAVDDRRRFPSPVRAPLVPAAATGFSDKNRQFLSSDALKDAMAMNSPRVEERPILPVFTLDPRPAAAAATEYYLHADVLSDYCFRRLYIMSYIPSGFWSRLITRLLGEEQLPNILDRLFKVVASPTSSTASPPPFVDSARQRSSHLITDRKLTKILDSNKPTWVLWQSGLEMQAFGQLLFTIKEFLSLADVRDVDYSKMNWQCRQEESVVAAWRPMDVTRSSIVEIYLPSLLITYRYATGAKAATGDQVETVQFETDPKVATKLLALVVELLDTLLEDWYPSLGTRFVHTSEGKLLVTRLVPCPKCLIPFTRKERSNINCDWTILSLDEINPPDSPSTKDGNRRISIEKQRSESLSSIDSDVPARGRSASAYELTGVEDVFPKSPRYGEMARLSAAGAGSATAFTVEECILAAHNSLPPKCPAHGDVSLTLVAPDTAFLDVSGEYLILPESVKRGKMLGRGAFGFVFKASVKTKAFGGGMLGAVASLNAGGGYVDVALKMLQPVDPGFGARSSAAAAYKAAWSKWQRDPVQYACRAYCTARQELNLLVTLNHPNVVCLMGVCPRPLALVVELAPLGSLNALLRNYKRSGARLNVVVLQETASQVAKALEYLHQNHIIYRDLKSENALVWRYPPPFSKLNDVLVKLGDYGISRSIFPSGGAKGFGGTEGFMAPEIMRYNGEEEYNEKVDCFSFGMFMYELLTFKLPFEGQEQVKELMLDGGRPWLMPSDLLYPSNCLDVMVVAWAQQPHDRPSSSQLVSICTAPEFSHMLDVTALCHPEAAVLSAESFAVDDTDELDESFEAELWLSRSDGQLTVLNCNQHGWLDNKSISINDDSFVTAMCLVEDTIWLAELTGVVRLFCARTYYELYNFSLSPHVLPNDQSPKHQLSLPIADIVYISSLRVALIAVSEPAALILCRMTDNLGGGQGDDPVIRVLKGPREIHCVVAITPPVQHLRGRGGADADKLVEVWTGESAGFVSCYAVGESSIEERSAFNHYDPPVAGVEVYRLVSSQRDGSFVWSYVYPGSILYQWNVSRRTIVAKLDSSKIAPCSESINTMNIEERMNPGRCQVTALCLVDAEDGGQLYVGTTWGVVIVAEADQLRPLAAFRPHLEDVRLIVPVDGARRPLIPGAARHLSAVSVDSRRRYASGESAPSLLSKTPSSLDQRSGTKSTSTSEKTAGASSYSSASTEGTFVITVGKGYRCLIQRFLDNYREEPQVLDSRNRDCFAVMWSTSDWLNS